MGETLQSEIILIAIGMLLGLVSYFLKKANDKIDETSRALIKLSEEMNLKMDTVEEKIGKQNKDTYGGILRAFQDMCHERQGACGLLRDAKLDRVEVIAKSACNKVERIEIDRARQWEKQYDFNEKFRQHIYKTKDNGASWEFRELKEDQK